MTESRPAAMGPPAGRDPLQALLDEGSRLRQRALELAARATDFAEEFELPPEAGGLALAGQRLDRDEYGILVVGEIKRGKSTLINALIGRPHLLPEDVRVATSRVFRVAHSEREAYRVRFEDGSSRPLDDPGDLTAFGSQVAADSGEAPPLDRMVKWIEVDLPFEILPRNIHFFDTPGTGGLQAAHGELTLGVLPEADGVVFVLDSEKPVEDGELSFLEAVLQQTPHVFFVQTKIDRSEQGWGEIRAKNLAHLRDRFGQALPGVSIWPFSSTRFQKACSLRRQGADRRVDADRVLGESRFPEFYPALMTFLYRVVGWSRSYNVSLLVGLYLKQGERTLAERWRSLRDDSWREEYRNRQAEKRRWYGEEGAEFARLRSDLLDGLRRDCSEAGYRMQIGLNGIELALRDAIDRVESLAEARAVADRLGEASLRGAADLWRSVRSAMVASLSRALDELFEAAELGPVETPTDELRIPGLGPRIDGDWGRRLQTAGGYASSLGVVFGGVPTAGLLVAGVLNPPLGALMAVVGGVATLVGFLVGWKSSGKAEAEALRAKLHAHLQRAMLTIRPHYARAVDILVRDLEKSLRGRIDRTSERKRAEAEAELGLIDREERMTARERADRARATEAQAARWHELARDAAELRAELDRLRERLVVANVGR